jgi:hypothetical protein
MQSLPELNMMHTGLSRQSLDSPFELGELRKMGRAPLAVAVMQPCHRLLLENLIDSTSLDGFEIALECKVEVGEGCQNSLKARSNVGWIEARQARFSRDGLVLNCHGFPRPAVLGCWLRLGPQRAFDGAGDMGRARVAVFGRLRNVKDDPCTSLNVPPHPGIETREQLMRSQRGGWTMPEEDMRSLLRLIEEKVRSSEIEVRHRDALIRLRSILESDLAELAKPRPEQQPAGDRAA